jgi:hypothetical protein
MDRSPVVTEVSTGTKLLMVFVGMSCIMLFISVVYAVVAINGRLSTNHDQAIAARQSAADELLKDTMFRERQDQDRQQELLRRLDDIDRDVKKGS